MARRQRATHAQFSQSARAFCTLAPATYLGFTLQAPLHAQHSLQVRSLGSSRRQANVIHEVKERKRLHVRGRQPSNRIEVQNVVE